MDEIKSYRCVNCGAPTGALYRTYGPSVLKLNKCDSCGGLVDKYVEYDSVIVMIDLVLMSKEAQRHVIYNTEFKSYWKLFIILILLETYGIWRNDSLFNIIVNSVCDIQTNSTINSTYLKLPINISVPDSWRGQCNGWVPEDRTDDGDSFLWEKAFYIQFISTFTGTIAFILTTHILLTWMRPRALKKNKVHGVVILKGFCVALASALLALPMLVWGAPDAAPHTAPDAPPHTRAAHYALAALYSCALNYHLLTVLYECSAAATISVLIMSNCIKYLTTFHMTPFLRLLIMHLHI